MDRADPGAGQHGAGGLGNHWQVDRDAIALCDAELPEHVGELADLAMQLAIGDFLVDRRIVALPQDCGLIAASGEMAVDAVVPRR